MYVWEGHSMCRLASGYLSRATPGEWPSDPVQIKEWTSEENLTAQKKHSTLWSA